MTDERMPSKTELLAALRGSRDEVVRIVRGLTREMLEQGRYENGWNGRQILAHLASIEWTYPRLIEARARSAANGDWAPKRSRTCSRFRSRFSNQCRAVR